MALTHTRPFSGHVFDESPWYGALAELIAPFRHHPDFPTPEELTALYAEIGGSDAQPLRFVPAPAKKQKRRRSREPIALASLYEGRIVEAHEVPTRLGDWHDLFNALAFCAFPRSKWALHARQYRIYAGRLAPSATRLPGARTREQDALALFDEGGLVVCVAACDDHEIPDDPELFDGALTRLVQADRARAVPFGHALYEHMVAGLEPPLAYAHVLTFEELPARSGLALSRHELTCIDMALARMLDDPNEFKEPQRARGLSLTELRSPSAD